LDALRNSNSPIGQEAAYNFFVFGFLGDIGKHLYWYNDNTKNASLTDIKDIIHDISEIMKSTSKKGVFTFEAYDVSEDSINVLQFNDEDKEELKNFLKVSCLKYTIDKNYEERIEELEDIVSEIEGENLLAKDSYKYYGVNRKDFS
jgi:hypothetical protein